MKLRIHSSPIWLSVSKPVKSKPVLHVDPNVWPNTINYFVLKKIWEIKQSMPETTGELPVLLSNWPANQRQYKLESILESILKPSSIFSVPNRSWFILIYFDDSFLWVIISMTHRVWVMLVTCSFPSDAQTYVCHIKHDSWQKFLFYFWINFWPIRTR